MVYLHYILAVGYGIAVWCFNILAVDYIIVILGIYSLAVGYDIAIWCSYILAVTVPLLYIVFTYWQWRVALLNDM